MDHLAKRKDIGVTGVLLILGQVISSFQSQEAINKKIEELKVDIHDIQYQHKHIFVQRSELSKLDSRLDKMTGQLDELRKQIGRIQTNLADRYSLEECDPLVSSSEPILLVSHE